MPSSRRQDRRRWLWNRRDEVNVAVMSCQRVADAEWHELLLGSATALAVLCLSFSAREIQLMADSAHTRTRARTPTYSVLSPRYKVVQKSKPLPNYQRIVLNPVLVRTLERPPPDWKRRRGRPSNIWLFRTNRRHLKTTKMKTIIVIITTGRNKSEMRNSTIKAHSIFTGARVTSVKA